MLVLVKTNHINKKTSLHLSYLVLFFGIKSKHPVLDLLYEFIMYIVLDFEVCLCPIDMTTFLGYLSFVFTNPFFSQNSRVCKIMSCQETSFCFAFGDVYHGSWWYFA